jgi:uridylate kinase
LENNLKNKRFLVKLSGEILKDDNSISWELANKISIELASIIKKGYQLGFVIGGGNIFRGASGNVPNYNRMTGDQIGMMATVLNGLTLVERLKANGIPAILQSGIKIEGVADLFDRNKVEETFNNGGAVVFCGGIGNPYFSTDTTSALRGLQIEADYIFKATKVDGIYDKDPVKHSGAKKFDTLSFDKIISMELEIMDLTAILLMKKNNMKLMVFNMDDLSNLEKACSGKKIGTIVEN